MLKKVLVIGVLVGICMSLGVVGMNTSLFSSGINDAFAANTTVTNVANCKCPPGKPKIFAIAGQGSTNEVDSGRFFQYLNLNYSDKASIQYEGLISEGFAAPKQETLNNIATDISNYIITTGGPVQIWSYSLGALYTPYIIELVKAKLAAAGVTCYNMDSVLVDPPFKDGWTVPSCATSILGVCGVEVFNFLNKWSDVVRNHPNLVNLSKGSIITTPQGELIPNVDKHYPFSENSPFEKTSKDAQWAINQIKTKLDSQLLNLCVAVQVLHADGTPAYEGSAQYSRTNPGLSAYAVTIKDIKDTSAHSGPANYTNTDGEATFVNLKAGKTYKIDAVIYDGQTLDTPPISQFISPTSDTKRVRIILGPRLSTGWYPANELREITTSQYKSFKPTTFQPSLERDPFFSCAAYENKKCALPAPNYSSAYPYQISTENRDLEHAGRVCIDSLGYLATTACVNNRMKQVARTEVLAPVKVTTSITASASCLSPETFTGNTIGFTVRAPQLGPNNPSNGIQNYKNYAYAVTLYVDGKIVVDKKPWKEPRGAVTYNFAKYMNNKYTTHEVYATVDVYTSNSYKKSNLVIHSESNRLTVSTGRGGCAIAKVFLPNCIMPKYFDVPSVNLEEITINLDSHALYNLRKNKIDTAKLTCNIAGVQVLQPALMKANGISLKVGNETANKIRTFAPDVIAPSGITELMRSSLGRYQSIFMIKK
jgi:hypothetical protein